MAPTLESATVLAKVASISSQAYVTFLAGNGDYVKGVVGLAKGLRKVNTAYPLVVGSTAGRSSGAPPHSGGTGLHRQRDPENQTQFAMAYYVINYSKLRIWEGAAGGETKNERRNGSGGKGKMPSGINCSMAVVVNDDFWNFFGTLLKVVVHNDDNCPLPPHTSLGIFLKTALKFGFFLF